MKKQAFPGHSYSRADFKACESTVTWWLSGFGQSVRLLVAFLAVSDID